MEIRPSYSRWIEQNRASNRNSDQPSLLKVRGNHSLVGCYYITDNTLLQLVIILIVY